MSLRLIPAVVVDVENAARFYRDLQLDLGARFREALNFSFGAIQRRPQSFPIVFGHRRAILRTFPYAVFFRVENDETFIVLVIHLSRRPQLAATLLRRRQDNS